VHDDSNVTSRDAATAKADSDHRAHGQPIIKVDFETQSAGLKEGQTLTVNLPRHRITNQTFLITSVDESETGGVTTWYKVSAIAKVLKPQSLQDALRKLTPEPDLTRERAKESIVRDVFKDTEMEVT
jgi:hypothetical protein